MSLLKSFNRGLGLHTEHVKRQCINQVLCNEAQFVLCAGQDRGLGKKNL